jgi:hypothetical protein
MFIIDRFEGDYALIEYKKRIFHMPKSILPKGAKEGNVINIDVTIDKEATDKKENSIKTLIDDVFKE